MNREIDIPVEYEMDNVGDPINEHIFSYLTLPMRYMLVGCLTAHNCRDFFIDGDIMYIYLRPKMFWLATEMKALLASYFDQGQLMP